MKMGLAILLSGLVCLCAPHALARDYIHAVGSSTVYPFVTSVSEEFGRESRYKTPVVEATGTGGGFKIFCSGTGLKYPDIADASRPIKDGERELCLKNGVKNPIEIKIGYDGIVLAALRKTETLSITRKELFLALAKLIPVEGRLVPNHYRYWDEISPQLAHRPILIYGPPTSSGTRDAFSDLVLEEECKQLPEFKAHYPDKEVLKKKCRQMREDGVFVEAGENDNLIVQKLIHNPDALGIFGFSFLDQNQDVLKATLIAGVDPDFDSIISGKYSISRLLYVYIKAENVGFVPGIVEFVKELLSDKALGQYGYTIDNGLIPLPREVLLRERTQIITILEALQRDHQKNNTKTKK
ncbi:MAG: substrate-binding domain-containing protein [Alphaproteobacteria bacterium]|nr:substrate-binding domain-containing protein [Alphaproteobacteria bacterium]